MADLDGAVERGQAAVDAAPAGHPNRPMYQSNLEGPLLNRYVRTGATADVDAAVAAARRRWTPAAAGRPNRLLYEANLALALRVGPTPAPPPPTSTGRSRWAGRSSTPPRPDPNRTVYLGNLALALLARFERDAARADQHEAREAFRWPAVAIETSPASARA